MAAERYDSRLPGLGGSFWSVADQAVVSLGTFLTSIMLARSLSPGDYGAYSALLAGLLFLNGIHTSLVTSPLSVEGAATDPATLRRYSTGAVLFTIVLAVPSGLLLAVPAGLGRSSLWIWAPVWLILWQVQETLRRSLMCGLGHRRAIWGDAVSYLGQAVLIWAGWRTGSLTLERAFAIIALTSGAAAVLQAVQAGLARVELAELRRLARGFWKFGSWMLYGCFASVFGSQAFFWVLAFSKGPQETASLQAVANVLGVCHPLMFGLGNLLVPIVARAKAIGGVTLAWRSAREQGVRFGLVLLAFFGILLLWPHTVLSMLYGPASRYAGLVGPLRLFVASYAFMYVAQVLGLFLTGNGKARAVFQVQLFGAFSSLLLGLPLAYIWGTAGACVGMLAVNITKFTASAICAFKRGTGRVVIHSRKTSLARALSPAAIKLEDC